MSERYVGRRQKRSGRTAAVAVAAAAALLAVTIAAGVYLADRSAGPDSSAARTQAGQEGAEGSAPISDQTDGSGAPASGSLPEAEQPEPPVEELPERYDFSQPVPESEAVDNSYFDDAAFVGDSRTDGFMIYSGIGTGKNLTSNGLSIFKLAEKKALTIGGKEYTLLEALALEQYGKVYLSLGVNELGVYDDEGFYRSYCEAIEQIRELQPDAVIYIQGLIPLNEGRIAATTGRSYLTNEHLRIYNDLMRKAAEEEQVAFLDLYSAFADENDELPADASKDGVHLYKPYCQRWLEYLKGHTVDFDTLYPEEEQG